MSIQSRKYEPEDNNGFTADDWYVWLEAEGFDVEMDESDETVYNGDSLTAHFRDFGIFVYEDGAPSNEDDELLQFIENRNYERTE